MAMLGAVVIGAGRIGKVHIKHLLECSQVRLLYVVDADVEAASSHVDGLRANGIRVHHVDDIEVVMADENVSVVLVCTPTAFHSKFIKLALNHRKSVFCEKPLSLDIKEVVECYELAKKNNLVLFCAFNRIFDPHFASVFKRQEEFAEKPKSIKITSRDHPRNSIEYLKISGGMVIDQCVHDLHMLRYVAHENPETIYVISHAHFDDIRDIGDVDQLYITCKFPSGCMGMVDANRESCYGHDQRIEIFGNKGMLNTENIRPHCFNISSANANYVSSVETDLIRRYMESYKYGIMHFLAVVEGFESSVVRGTDTVWVTLLCLAGQKSIETGLPININHFVDENYKEIGEKLKKWESHQEVTPRHIN